MLLSLGLVYATCALATPFHKRQAPAGVPGYVINYAPMVYLYSEDPYLPSDIGNQLAQTQPELNYTVISGAPSPVKLDNLNQLNNLGGDDVYLTSKTDITQNPSWLFGVKPDSNGKTNGAVSSTIIVNDHGSGLVDAFYFYFYAFNQGGIYLGLNVDDHVGDWEHNMVRFQDSIPQAIWYSQHSNGEAFTYDVVNKYKGGLRPITFSANGTHANYAISGDHGYGIPDVNTNQGIIEDHTDEGPLWDPTLSAYYYSYDANSQKFASYDNSTSVNWLYYIGHWGDKQYPDSDPRQQSPFGISGLAKYQDGPTGPEDKQLNRTNVCPDDGIPCIVRTVLGP